MTKKVLMVLTSYGPVIEGTEKPTGWYLPECAHPFLRFKRAGYDIKFASPKGGVAPIDTGSIDLTDAENKEFWENESYKALTENTAKLSEVLEEKFDLLFFVGGFGVMWDFPFEDSVAKIASKVYDDGGVVGAVCHGPIALANVKLSDGEYLVKGKEVAGFCNEEEAVVGLLDKLPTHEGLGQSCEDVLTARGANYVKAGPWVAKVAQAPRLFTGQNPASAGPLAEAIIAAF